MSSMVLKVQGMSCGGCSSKVIKAINAIEGVDHVDVVLETGQVTVDYSNPELHAEQLKDVIEDLGFDVVN